MLWSLAGVKSVPAGKKAGLVLCNASTEFFCFGVLVGFELISALVLSGFCGCGQQVDSYKIHAHNKKIQGTAPAAQHLIWALAAMNSVPKVQIIKLSLRWEFFGFVQQSWFYLYCEFSGSVPAGVQALSFFPMVPRQHKQQRKSQRWGGFSFSGEQTFSLLPYNATPVSAWLPSQQVLAISSDQFVNFLVCLHNQAFTNSRLLGSEFKLNSPALLSSAWRKVHCKWREKSLQVWCPKLTPEWQGQLTKKSRGLRPRRSTWFGR